MDAVTIRSETWRVLVTLTVVGSVLLTAGALLGVLAAVPGVAPPRGWPVAALLAWCLIGAGLLCGAAVAAFAVLADHRPLSRGSRDRDPGGPAGSGRRKVRRAGGKGTGGRRRASPGHGGG